MCRFFEVLPDADNKCLRDGSLTPKVVRSPGCVGSMRAPFPIFGRRSVTDHRGTWWRQGLRVLDGMGVGYKQGEVPTEVWVRVYTGPDVQKVGKCP